MLSDFRYAVRALRHNPGFAATAIISLALGIGANSAIFSLADGLLLRPLPVPNASRVVTLRSRTPSGTAGDVSYADFTDFRDKNRSFDGLVAFALARIAFAPDRRVQPELKAGMLVSGNFFRALHVEPQTGRGFKPEEDQVPGRHAVAVLGHDFWKNQYASDPSVIGRNIRLNGVDFTVIGVAPESFTGMDQYIRPAFFIPAMMAPSLQTSNQDILTNRSKRTFTVKGPLKSGVSIQTASAELAGLAKSLEQIYPNTNRAFSAMVRTELQTRAEFQQGDVLLVSLLFSVVVVVLLIACANVANLIVGRGRARVREISVRLAIGASRSRLVRQLMAESLLIASAGGALGLLIAQLVVEAAGSVQVPGDIPIQFSFQLDHRVLLFTLLVSAACALVFGLLPALQSTRTDLVPALKAGELTQGRKRLLGRNALVVVQVAGSLVLLVTATQLFRGFSFLLAHSPGFRTDHLIMASFDPGMLRYSNTQTDQFYKNLIERTRALPGVQSAALTFSVPMGTTQHSEIAMPEGYQFPRGKESAEVLANIVDSNYFETFGVPVLRGRAFLPTDRESSPRVAVVNEAFARHFFGQNAIGKRIRLKDQDGPWVEVVGVVATGKYFSLVEPPTDCLYLPFAQNPEQRMMLLAQAVGDPASLAAPLREIARSLDANMPVFGVRTMGDFFDQRGVKLLHLINGIVGVVGLLGLALALVGLYAIVAYQVARRTREIGIRMAIGADRSQVMRMVLRQASVMGLAGVAIGVVLCFAGGRALTVALRAPAFDPILFTLVPIALLLTMLLAAAIPARRAALVDPVVALRQD
jgi:predicted permease